MPNCTNNRVLVRPVGDKYKDFYNLYNSIEQYLAKTGGDGSSLLYELGFIDKDTRAFFGGLDESSNMEMGNLVFSYISAWGHEPEVISNIMDKYDVNCIVIFADEMRNGYRKSDYSREDFWYEDTGVAGMGIWTKDDVGLKHAFYEHPCNEDEWEEYYTIAWSSVPIEGIWLYDTSDDGLDLMRAEQDKRIDANKNDLTLRAMALEKVGFTI